VHVGTMVKSGQMSVGTMVKDGYMSVGTMVKESSERSGARRCISRPNTHKRNLLKTADCGSKLTALKLLSVSSHTKVKAFRRQPRAWSYISDYIKDIMYVDSRVTRSRSVSRLDHVYLQRKLLTMIAQYLSCIPNIDRDIFHCHQLKKKQYFRKLPVGKFLVNVSDIARIYVFTFHFIPL